MPAIEALAAEGVNVNVTLLFSRAAYRRAAEAWMSGPSGCAARIANAKLAYVDIQRIVVSERRAALAARGARPQRVLFASTSVKDPRYPELMYVESLVGPGTVNTVPPTTLEALRRGLEVRATLEEDVDDAQRARLGAPAAHGPLER
jgi:transaldolase